MTVRKPGARNKRKDYGYNEYPKGRGRIKCEICGYPVRDHESYAFCDDSPSKEKR